MAIMSKFTILCLFSFFIVRFFLKNISLVFSYNRLLYKNIPNSASIPCIYIDNEAITYY